MSDLTTGEQFLVNALADAVGRQRMLYAGMNGNTKRTKLWDEFGYPEQVEFDGYYRAYERTPATTSLAVGATRQLTGTVLPADATDKSGTWTTSDATKATVSSTGLVTGVATGTATITFTSTDGAFTGSTAATITA